MGKGRWPVLFYGDEDASQEAALLHRAYLTIFEMESKNILFANRWREDDGTFIDEDHRNAFLFDMIRDNSASIQKLLEEIDELVEIYPAFVILPLLRAFGSLTVRVLKCIRLFEGALLSVWKVMKRFERHTTSNQQAENGWAVLRSAWYILLKTLEDNDLDREHGYDDFRPFRPF
ncbi:MAG: hypothetical protein ACXVP5_04490 [Tumebacillaceae bacterium]